MRICQNLLTHRLRRLFPSPNLSPTEEETLLGRETIDVCRPRLALHRFLKSEPRQFQTAKIPDRFNQNEFAVLVKVDFVDAETRELLFHAVGTIRIVLRVGICPPVFQIALVIKLAALVVESV